MSLLRNAALAAAAALVHVSSGADGLTGAIVDVNYLRWQGSGVSFFKSCPEPFTIGPGVECSYSGLGNTFTADFTDTQLIIDQVVNPGYRSLPWNFDISQLFAQPLYFKTMTLVSSDFIPAAPSAGVGGFTYVFRPHTSGTTSSFIISFGGVADGDHHYHAVFDMTAGPIPEPATYALMLGGLAALGFLTRRRTLGR